MTVVLDLDSIVLPCFRDLFVFRVGHGSTRGFVDGATFWKVSSQSYLPSYRVVHTNKVDSWYHD